MNDVAQLLMSSPVGEVLLETDGNSITTIHFCDEPLELSSQSSHELLLQAKYELESYFSGRLNSFSFPLAQTGTAFQQRVWNTLMEIPFGKTVSYKTMAIQLGDEKCIRAAASANGKNKLAIVVPCHRVIGSSGELIGYAGGLWRKKWLLAHEAKYAGAPVQSSLF